MQKLSPQQVAFAQGAAAALAATVQHCPHVLNEVTSIATVVCSVIEHEEMTPFIEQTVKIVNSVGGELISTETCVRTGGVTKLKASRLKKLAR